MKRTTYDITEMSRRIEEINLDDKASVDAILDSINDGSIIILELVNGTTKLISRESGVEWKIKLGDKEKVC